MSAEQRELHFVSIIRDESGQQVVTFECRGGPDDACHRHPDTSGCGCERWTDEQDERESFSRGEVSHTHEWAASECWLTHWFTNGYAVYEGDDPVDDDETGLPADMVQVVPSPIRASFDGDYVAWQWARDIYGRLIP